MDMYKVVDNVAVGDAINIQSGFLCYDLEH
jgi:hypothetical protein